MEQPASIVETIVNQELLNRYRNALPSFLNPYYSSPIVLDHGEGSWVFDDEGNRYLDFLAGYGAVNQGHAHPRLVQAMQTQAARLTMLSRVYHHDTAAAFYRELRRITGFDQAVLMNSGAEAVETALKLARRWASRDKDIVADRAEIIAVDGNTETQHPRDLG